jgi:hypothetical protein
MTRPPPHLRQCRVPGVALGAVKLLGVERDLTSHMLVEVSVARLLAPVSDYLEQGWAAHQKLSAVRSAMSLSDFVASFCPRNDAPPS